MYDPHLCFLFGFLIQMSKSGKSKIRMEDLDGDLTDEEVAEGKYFGLRHKGLAGFFPFVFYFHVLNLDSYEKDVELRKQPSTPRKGCHEKAAKIPGEEFVTSFFGLDEKGLLLF